MRGVDWKDGRLGTAFLITSLGHDWRRYEWLWAEGVAGGTARSKRRTVHEYTPQRGRAQARLFAGRTVQGAGVCRGRHPGLTVVAFDLSLGMATLSLSIKNVPVA